jgi:integrase
VARRSEFGTARQLPSGRWQARYSHDKGRHTALASDGSPTFDTKRDALKALARVRLDIEAGDWSPPMKRIGGESSAPGSPLTLSEYAARWLAERDLAARTREHYAQILRDHIEPTFGAVALADITKPDVTTWHARLAGTTGPTARAQAYGLLRTLMATAVTQDLIPATPCVVRGAGQVKRARKIRPATLAELEAVVAALPQKYRPMALLAAWCALRFGELAELRRSDVDLKAGTLTISRGVVRTKEHTRLVKDPKTEAGRRTVAIPPHLIPILREHLSVVRGKDGLLFPSASDPTKQLAHSALNKVWLRARAEAGRPDLAFHDLRHTGAVLAAQSGATLAELMARLGHSTPAAAMRYQHASVDRDRALAARLSELAANGER